VLDGTKKLSDRDRTRTQMKFLTSLTLTAMTFALGTVVAPPSQAGWPDVATLSEMIPLGTYVRNDGKETITLTNTTTKTCNARGCLTRQITSKELGPYWMAFDDDASEANGYLRYEPRQGYLEYLTQTRQYKYYQSR